MVRIAVGSEAIPFARETIDRWRLFLCLKLNFAPVHFLQVALGRTQHDDGEREVLVVIVTAAVTVTTIVATICFYHMPGAVLKWTCIN